MIEQDIKVESVTKESKEQAHMQAAAQLVETWLTESPGSKDKPINEILDPIYNGTFIFLRDVDGNPDYSSGPLAFISQRQIVPKHTVWNPKHYGIDVEEATALHEISSLVVSPDWQGKGLGTDLVTTFTEELLELYGDISLVAIAHPGSAPLFEKAGFSEQTGMVFGQWVDPDAVLPAEAEFNSRVQAGQMAGKVLMAYGASIN
jgi:GNAT superfamily N-acetyltransferase